MDGAAWFWQVDCNPATNRCSNFIPNRHADNRSNKAMAQQERLSSPFGEMYRKGKDFWAFTLITGGRPTWGQGGFLSPALNIVVVSPQRTVSRVMPGWQQ